MIDTVETVTCASCNRETTSCHDTGTGHLVCPSCFSRFMERFWNREGHVSFGLKELRELFENVGTREKKRVTRQATLFSIMRQQNA